VADPSAVHEVATAPLAIAESQEVRVGLGRAAGRLLGDVSWADGVQLYDVRDPTAP
jgi:hypothetical protein